MEIIVLLYFRWGAERFSTSLQPVGTRSPHTALTRMAPKEFPFRPQIQLNILIAEALEGKISGS